MSGLKFVSFHDLKIFVNHMSIKCDFDSRKKCLKRFE